MTVEELAELVRQLRDAQAAVPRLPLVAAERYARHQESLRLERAVDLAVAGVLAEPEGEKA